MRNLSILFVLCLLGAVLAYLLLAPIRVEPVAWQPLPPPASDSGPYARNELLKAVERIGRGKGPELIALDRQGRIYSGFEDGRVARFEQDGSGYTLIANTGGRPLGVFVHPDGSVIVCDAKKGLLKLSEGGQITVLATGVNGVPFGFANDLAVTSDGSKVYFSGLLHEIPLPAHHRRHRRAWRAWPFLGLRLRHGQSNCAA